MSPLMPANTLLTSYLIQSLDRCTVHLNKKNYYVYLTLSFMEPRGSMPHLQGLSSNPYPKSNQPIPRIDTFFFKVHFNIVLPSPPRPS